MSKRSGEFEPLVKMSVLYGLLLMNHLKLTHMFLHVGFTLFFRLAAKLMLFFLIKETSCI